MTTEKQQTRDKIISLTCENLIMASFLLPENTKSFLVELETLDNIHLAIVYADSIYKRNLALEMLP